MERTGKHCNMHSLHWHNRDKKGKRERTCSGNLNKGLCAIPVETSHRWFRQISEEKQKPVKRSRTGQGLGLIDFLWKLYVQEYTINHANLSSHGDQLPWISASVILVSSKYYFCSYKYFSLISVKMLLCFFIFSSFFCVFNIVLINFYFNLILCYFSTST